MSGSQNKVREAVPKVWLTRILMSILLVVAPLLVASCGFLNLRMYEGEKKNENQIAVIWGSSTQEIGDSKSYIFHVQELDGKEINAEYRKVEVLEGTYRVKLRVEAISWVPIMKHDYSDRVSLMLDAEKGKTYSFSFMDPVYRSSVSPKTICVLVEPHEKAKKMPRRKNNFFPINNDVLQRCFEIKRSE